MIRDLKSGMVINCHEKKGGSFFQGGFSGSMFSSHRFYIKFDLGYFIARVCFPLESQKKNKTKISVEKGGGQDVFKHLDGNLKIAWQMAVSFPFSYWPMAERKPTSQWHVRGYPKCVKPEAFHRNRWWLLARVLGRETEERKSNHGNLTRKRGYC